MACKECWIAIPDCLYNEWVNEHNVKINDLECCITCMHSVLDEYAKMETETSHILKLRCGVDGKLFPADTICDEHITQMRYDEIQEYKEQMGY